MMEAAALARLATPGDRKLTIVTEGSLEAPLALIENQHIPPLAAPPRRTTRGCSVAAPSVRRLLFSPIPTYCLPRSMTPRAVLILGLLFTLPLAAQTTQLKPLNPLAAYPQRYALINRELPSYRTIAVDMETLGIEHRSTDGGKVQVSCKGADTRLIVATDFGEHGSTTTNFYFWNHSLFFVQILSQRSDELYGPAVESSDNRLYYLNGKLVQWLDEHNAAQPMSTADARKTDRFVRKDAATFLAKLDGCPTSVLAAADADTAAPAMVPIAQHDTTAHPTRKQLEDIHERAYVAAMKSDLRTLATYEEQFAADNNGAYFGGKASASSPLYGFTPSNLVTIAATKVGGSRPNWSATATHAKSSTICVERNGVISCE
jgi:hypothetical protein